MCASVRLFLSLALACLLQGSRAHGFASASCMLACTQKTPNGNEQETLRDSEFSSPGCMISAYTIDSCASVQGNGRRQCWGDPVHEIILTDQSKVNFSWRLISCDYVCIYMWFCRLAAGFAFVRTWSNLYSGRAYGTVTSACIRCD
jgi:hypothetical protein